jgi:hypothetical protein
VFDNVVLRSVSASNGSLERTAHWELLSTFTRYYRNHQIKEDEMDNLFSMHGRKMRAYKILVGKAEEKIHREDPGIGGR